MPKTAQAKKAKGRNFQQLVRDKILFLFPHLTKDDVWSRSMGAQGTDVQLSAAARSVFPYEIECKAQEKYKGVYDAFEQAKAHGNAEPVVFLKMNYKEPLAIVRADHFFELVKNGRTDNL